MQRRLHPGYDRRMLRVLLTFASLMILSGGLAVCGSWWAFNWITTVALMPLLALLLWSVLKGRHINAIPCPQCGEPLRRPPDCTEFLCQNCSTTWWTKSYGSSLWDWFH